MKFNRLKKACLLALGLSWNVLQADPMPPLAAEGVDGSLWQEDRFAKAPLSLILFFSTKCVPCQPLLETLNGFMERGILVVAISQEPLSKLKQFAAQKQLMIPLLHGDRELFARYRTLGVYPTLYLIGPGQQVLEVFQGRSVTGEVLWLTLADRLMQKGDYELAAQLYTQVRGEGFRNKARLGLAYAYLKQDRFEEAEPIFRELLSSKLAADAWEGIAELKLQQGMLAEALKAVKEALALDPNRPVAKALHARILFRQGETKRAERAIEEAESQVEKATFTWQKAETFVTRGNLARHQREPKLALTSYRKAEKVSPLSVAAVSNQAVVLLEDLKDHKGALKILERAQKIAPQDPLTRSLLIQAKKALAFQQDLERRRYIQSLVKDLVKRYQAQKKETKPQDEWTSPPMVLSVLPFRNRSPSLGGRLGIEKALQDALVDALKANGLMVVERELLDQLLEELKLGSSDLADPDTQLRLGRIMAARLLASGALVPQQRRGMAFLRLADTETTQIVASFPKRFRKLDPFKLADLYAQEIKKLIAERYPLRGRIALVENDQVALNLGRKHGVQPGMVFEVLEEGEPIELNGRLLGYRQRVVGQVKVVDVQEGFSMAQVIAQEGGFQKNQKVRLQQKPTL